VDVNDSCNYWWTHSPSQLAWSEVWRPLGAQSAFIKWTGWTLDSTVNIVVVIIIITIVIRYEEVLINMWLMPLCCCKLIRLRRLWLPSVWRRRRVLWLQVSSAGPATWNASCGLKLTRRPTTQTTSKRWLHLMCHERTGFPVTWKTGILCYTWNFGYYKSIYAGFDTVKAVSRTS